MIKFELYSTPPKSHGSRLLWMDKNSKLIGEGHSKLGGSLSINYIINRRKRLDLPLSTEETIVCIGTVDNYEYKKLSKHNEDILA